MPRHRHRKGYVCLVVAGGYEEAGDSGRFQVRAGGVVFHGPFDAHLDRFLPTGADTINFELDGWSEHEVDFGHVPDPDLIARIAERDTNEARALLLKMTTPVERKADDWPDELATRIRRNADLSLSMWAETHRLAAGTLSRGFRKLYGLSPKAFRAQMRARNAWREIVDSRKPLSAIASEGGFSDQAHMTRALRALTGHTPAQWRLPHVK